MQLSGNGNVELFFPVKISVIILTSISDALLVPSAKIAMATSRLQRSSLTKDFSSAGYDKEFAVGLESKVQNFIATISHMTYIPTV